MHYLFFYFYFYINFIEVDCGSPSRMDDAPHVIVLFIPFVNPWISYLPSKEGIVPSLHEWIWWNFNLTPSNNQWTLYVQGWIWRRLFWGVDDGLDDSISRYLGEYKARKWTYKRCIEWFLKLMVFKVFVWWNGKMMIWMWEMVFYYPNGGGFMMHSTVLFS